MLALFKTAYKIFNRNYDAEITIITNTKFAEEALNDLDKRI